MAFRSHEVLPDIFHIEDSLDVCMTLIRGTTRSLLIDTGYGFEDIKSYVSALTPNPVTVLLTHGHYDHAMGARYFENVFLTEPEFPIYRTYTGEKWRRHILQEAREAGLSVDEEACLSAQMAAPHLITDEEIYLGGITARVICCPGHTPGSLVVYVPERRLLLTGDDWNPCTWAFFPEALDAVSFRQNMRRLIENIPFRHVLCSHETTLFPREMPEAFFESLTDECLENAKSVDTGAYPGIRTAEAALPMDQVFVFDVDKFMIRK